MAFFGRQHTHVCKTIRTIRQGMVKINHNGVHIYTHTRMYTHTHTHKHYTHMRTHIITQCLIHILLQPFRGHTHNQHCRGICTYIGTHRYIHTPVYIHSYIHAHTETYLVKWAHKTIMRSCIQAGRHAEGNTSTMHTYLHATI